MSESFAYAECVDGGMSLDDWARTVAKPRLMCEGCDLGTVRLTRMTGRHLVYFAEADRREGGDGD